MVLAIQLYKNLLVTETGSGLVVAVGSKKNLQESVIILFGIIIISIKYLCRKSFAKTVLILMVIRK